MISQSTPQTMTQIFVRDSQVDALPSQLWNFGCNRALNQVHIQGLPHAFELLDRLPDDGFAVVGTRHPQARSIQLLQNRISGLRNSKRIILSGLALGIDTAAHEAALKAGLPTIAILGSPLTEIYPRQNRELARRILDSGGLLVSEYAPGTKCERHFFLMRNRLIAGWSKATWVVQAGYRSGALNTAQWANDMDRDCYATPAFPGDLMLEGNLNYIHCEKAQPFWKLEDLTATWDDLGYLTQDIQGKRKTRIPPELLKQGDLFAPKEGLLPDDKLLQYAVARVTAHRGGAQVDEMLDWSIQQKWEPQRFFNALHDTITGELVTDQNGVLTAILLDQT